MQIISLQAVLCGAMELIKDDCCDYFKPRCSSFLIGAGPPQYPLGNKNRNVKTGTIESHPHHIALVVK